MKNISENSEIFEDFNNILNEFLATQTKLIHKLSLNPGDALIWWDSLVIHGRSAVTGSSSTNNRYYRKHSFNFTKT